LLRAAIVVMVVATPSLLLPGTTQEGAQMVMLVALCLGAGCPALVEFRDAPPFNRVRVLSLLVMLFLLSLVAGGGNEGSSLILVLNALGFLVGHALEFPWSPLSVLLDRLPPEAAPVQALQVKIMAGLATLVALVALVAFVLLLRLRHWPSRSQAFNVWINLPTFDPTTGGDIVARLKRDARVNVILGFAVAFVVPVVGLTAADHVGVMVLSSPHTMVWGISMWMFLPLSMVMRGLAMARIADMIRDRRARLVASVASDAGGQPA
jgi:hypothetical protein